MSVTNTNKQTIVCMKKKKRKKDKHNDRNKTSVLSSNDRMASE